VSRGRRYAAAVVVIAGVALWVSTGCDRKAIPARSESPVVAQAPPTPAASPAAPAPESWLAKGERVFFDDFERPELGASWTTTHRGWRIVDGSVFDENAKNAGLWLEHPLPERARVSFRARSGSMPAGKPFPGDVKCEVFATTAEHQAGYVLINGGWNNQLDVIARLDEHGKDRAEQPAERVLPDAWAQWDIVRVDGSLYWFREGKLLMSYVDAEPIQGTVFGFNNWASRVSFDDLAVYALP
jgi:hypothetical protein